MARSHPNDIEISRDTVRVGTAHALPDALALARRLVHPGRGQQNRVRAIASLIVLALERRSAVRFHELAREADRSMLTGFITRTSKN